MKKPAYGIQISRETVFAVCFSDVNVSAAFVSSHNQRNYAHCIREQGHSSFHENLECTLSLIWVILSSFSLTISNVKTLKISLASCRAKSQYVRKEAANRK